MLNSDIKFLKKGFKNLSIKEIKYYCIKEDKIKHSSNLDNILDEEIEEKLIKGVKKIISKNPTKIFDLKIKDDNKKVFLKNLVNNQNLDSLDDFVKENKNSLCIGANFLYGIKFELSIPIKSENEEEEEEIDFKTLSFFVFLSVAGDDFKEIGYNLNTNTHNTISLLNLHDIDYILNLDKPVDAIMYPCIENTSPNLQKLVYYTNKANDIKNQFTNTWGCEFTLSAKQEKEVFDKVLQQGFYNINNKKLFNIYKDIFKFYSEDNDKISTIKLLEVLKKYEPTKDISLNEIFEKYNSNIKQNEIDAYEFKIQNLIPDFSKNSLSIKNSQIDMKISPIVLNSLKTIEENGEQFIVLKLEDKLTIDNLDLEVDIEE